MFMSVDLPAPFSPSSAWISRSLRSSSMASLATVPVGKRLVMSCISRTGVLSLIVSFKKGAGRPEGRPAPHHLLVRRVSRDGFELPRLHVRESCLELVLEACRDRSEVADGRKGDAVVRGVVEEVAALLALVLLPLALVTCRCLALLRRARVRAVLRGCDRLLLVLVLHAGIDPGVACRTLCARVGKCRAPEDYIDAVADHRLGDRIPLVRRVEVL